MYKKNTTNFCGKTLVNLINTTIVMRLFSTLLIICIHISVFAFGQKITLYKSDATLSSVIKEIKKQSGYNVLYDTKALLEAPRVNVNVTEVTVSEALDQCFRALPLSYVIKDNNIIISKRNRNVQQIIKQQKEITGQVTNEQGEPLEGVTVSIKNMPTVTTTDINGHYRINVAQEGMTLMFSIIGFTSKQVIANSTTINVVLTESISGLDEVIVVGYGTQRESDITGSVVRVKIDKTADLPNSNILQSIQGRVPGVNVTSSNRPGENPGLSIRGVNSISAGNSPLVVVDGIIYNGSFSDFNANDIATVDILKDASAAAVYGSRAANGVLLLTTKSGTSNKPQFNFSTYQGVQNPDKLIPVLDGPGYLQKILDFREAAKLEADPAKISDYLTVAEAENYKNGSTVNWMDSVMRTGIISNYHLDISGKTENTNYYVAGTYYKEEGIVKNDNFDRITLNLNLTNNITDWYSIAVKSMFSSQNRSGRPASLTAAYQQSPYGNFFDENGPGGYALLPVGDPIGVHPFANMLIQNKDTRMTLWGLVSSNMDVPFIPGLKWTMNYSSNFRKRNQAEYLDNLSSNTGIVANGIGTKDEGEAVDWTFDNILNYKKIFNDVHSLDITLLYSREGSDTTSSGLRGTNFFTQVLGYNNLGIAEVQQIASNYEDQNSVAFMARANYSYDKRYAVTFTTRRDGFSGFSQNNKYATFPSIAFAWTATNEQFLNNVSWLSNLKLRLSYGKNGNQAIGRYQSLAIISPYKYVFDQQSITTINVSSIANNNLSWETTTTKNIGVDFEILNRRINGSVDVYSSETEDILLRRALPETTGFTEILTNVGKVHNHGVEFALNSINIQNTNLRWESGFVFSLNRNRIDKLTGQDANGDGIEDDDIRNGWFIGKSLNSIYGYKTNGIYQLNEENIPSGFAPGEFRIVDTNNDGKITPEDRAILGNSLPNYSFSISNSIGFKNFNFYMLINAVQGGGSNNSYVADNTATRSVNSPSITFTERYNIQNVPYWTPSRPSNDYPIINYNPTLPHYILESRSFVRIQDVSLSYTFDKSILNKIKVNNLKLFVSAKNLYTFTKWTGYDPENATTLRDFPLMRTYTLGLDFAF